MILGGRPCSGSFFRGLGARPAFVSPGSPFWVRSPYVWPPLLVKKYFESSSILEWRKSIWKPGLKKLFLRRILTYPVFQNNLKEDFHFRSNIKYCSTGKEQSISVPPSPHTICSDYTLLFVWREEGGRWCWITDRIALGDHSASWGGMGFGGEGFIVFFHSYFTCSVLVGLSTGGQGGIFLRSFSRL